MNTTTTAIQQHYESVEGGGDVLSQVQAVLSQFPEGLLQPEQLAGMDQFHVRGLPATVELADMASLSDSSFVLDAGSGFGGSSRYLAKRFGCKVTGVDLTPSYVAISTLITERTGLAHLAEFQAAEETADLRCFRGAHLGIIAQCLGLRVSEIAGLKWDDFDSERRQLLVQRSIVNGRVDDVKTEYSHDFVPLHESLIEVMLAWSAKAYPTEEGWVFANPMTSRPFYPTEIQKRHLRPLGNKLGLARSAGIRSATRTARGWTRPALR